MSDETPKGETKFNIDGDPGEAVKFAFKPLPAGQVKGRIDFRKAECKKAEKSGYIRINYGIQILGSGKDGKKDRLVFESFNLGLEVGKDGVQNWRRASQILGFAHAAKVDVKQLMNGLDVATVHEETEEGDTIEHKQLHPKQLLTRLKELGVVDVDLRIKIEGQGKGEPGRNRVDFFIAPKSHDSLMDDEPEPQNTVTDVSTDTDLEEIK